MKGKILASIGRSARRMLWLSAVCLLAACSTPLQNHVTAFNDWPRNLQDKSFAMDRTAEQANDLEYQTYENMLRNELARLGFVEKPARDARLAVKLQYQWSARDVQIYAPVADPYYMPWGWGWGGPGFGCRGPQGYYPPGIYYPGCGAPPVVQQEATRTVMYARQVRVVISDAASKRNLFDVTVNGDDTMGSLPELMPWMLRAAFENFPGENGVPRVVKYTLPKKEQAQAQQQQQQ